MGTQQESRIKRARGFVDDHGLAFIGTLGAVTVFPPGLILTLVVAGIGLGVDSLLGGTLSDQTSSMIPLLGFFLVALLYGYTLGFLAGWSSERANERSKAPPADAE
jgi:hypothetical protein